jgi:outer membrane murein-binding lipoprotein Lpp
MLTRPPRSAMTCLTAAGIGALLMLAGCDFWPPALQAQIEQLHAEAQQTTADKALLQNQLNAANKAKEELQIRVEDLTRVNKEKSAMIANLEHTLSAAREAGKGGKIQAVKTSGKTVAKKPVKPAPKTSVKPSGKSPNAKKPKPAPVRRAPPDRPL